MKRYVLGFVFDWNGESVVLIKKNRPEWQAGKCNGVGGKIEDGERPMQAMVREYFEETGVQTDTYKWTPFFQMRGPDWECFCYYIFNDAFCYLASTTTDEEISRYNVNALPATLSNVRWLVPMAIDHWKHSGKSFVATATYGG